jgi:hypothetical protein
MLDFYALPDARIRLEDDAYIDDQHLGGLNIAEVKALACVQERCQERGIPVISFVVDSWWTTAEVRQILAISRECLGRGGGPQAIDRLITMLEQAAAQELGVAAFCD